MKSHHKQLYRVSCFTFSASLWVLFGLSLWRMNFSVMDLLNFGQRLANSTTLNGGEEVVQSGFLP